MMIASNTGYTTITQKIAIPLDDERSARLTVSDIIKKEKNTSCNYSGYQGFFAEMKYFVKPKIRREHIK